MTRNFQPWAPLKKWPATLPETTSRGAVAGSKRGHWVCSGRRGRRRAKRGLKGGGTSQTGRANPCWWLLWPPPGRRRETQTGGWGLGTAGGPDAPRCRALGAQSACPGRRHGFQKMSSAPGSGVQSLTWRTLPPGRMGTEGDSGKGAGVGTLRKQVGA